MLVRAWNAIIEALLKLFTALLLPDDASTPSPHDDNDSQTTALRLTYFDAPGLAECTRNTFKLGEITFEDERIDKDVFAERKEEFPFGKLPVLRLDEDTTIAQSMAILRYASRLVKTYPSSPESGAIIDQWTDLHVEFMGPITLDLYPDKFGVASLDKKAHRKWCLEEHIPRFMTMLNDELVDSVWLGEFDQVTMADMVWFPTIEWLTTSFDGLDKDAFFQEYPHIQRHAESVREVLGS